MLSDSSEYGRAVTQMSEPIGSRIAIYTRLTMLYALLGGILVVIGFLIGGSGLALVFLAVSFIFNFIMYFVSDKIVLASTGARVVSESEAPRLHSIVSQMARQVGIPKPKVAIVDAPQPNAFATGRNKNNALVASTTGLLTMMRDDEIVGVMAHEVGHVVHRDMLVSTIAASMATAISYISNIVMWTLLFGAGVGRNRDDGGREATLLASALIAPIAATFVQLAVSRSREYYADEASARLTGKPQSLIRALTKIENFISSGAPLKATPATASLWFANPFRGNSLLELLSTHPSTGHRVQRLERIAKEMGVHA